jgi:protein SCO1/2
MRNKSLLVLVAVLALVLAWAAFVWKPSQAPQPAASPAPVTAPPAGGDFTLSSAAASISLKDYRGKVVLLYFGYASCPDICPASLSAMAQAMAALDESESRQVSGLFVSVDPERDTAERLKDHAAYYHPALIGTTGSIEELTAATALYGASFSKQEAKPDGSYAVEHSTSTYVIDQNGSLAATLPHGTPATEVLAQIRKLVRQQLPTPPSPPAPAQ